MPPPLRPGSSSSNRSSRAARGRTPAPSSVSVRPLAASWATTQATPPTPLMKGSTTPTAKAAATAASAALPPRWRISTPASAASGCMAVTRPPATATSLLSMSSRLRWIGMASLPRRVARKSEILEQSDGGRQAAGRGGTRNRFASGARRGGLPPPQKPSPRFGFFAWVGVRSLAMLLRTTRDGAQDLAFGSPCANPPPQKPSPFGSGFCDSPSRGE